MKKQLGIHLYHTHMKENAVNKEEGMSFNSSEYTYTTCHEPMTRGVHLDIFVTEFMACIASPANTFIKAVKRNYGNFRCLSMVHGAGTP